MYVSPRPPWLWFRLTICVARHTRLDDQTQETAHHPVAGCSTCPLPGCLAPHRCCCSCRDCLGTGVRRPATFVITRTEDQNVLLITIDTLRADALGSYGGVASTPALDRLAAAGVRYTFAHAHAPLTLVSHASMLSGLYPFQHGIRDNSGFRFPAAMPTAATRLKASGFATGAFVGAFPLHSQFGLNVGFDVYDENFRETTLPSGLRDFGASGDGGRRRRASMGRAAAGALVRVGPCVRPARAVSTAGAVRVALRRQSLRWRGGSHRRGARAAPRRCARPDGQADIGHRDRRPWRGARRPRRADAWTLRLRVDAAGSRFIVAQVGGSHPREAGIVSDDPVRHIDILPTVLDALGRPPEATLPGRSLLTAAPDPQAITSRTSRRCRRRSIEGGRPSPASSSDATSSSSCRCRSSTIWPAILASS